jgi:hypothetical protein
MASSADVVASYEKLSLHIKLLRRCEDVAVASFEVAHTPSIGIRRLRKRGQPVSGPRFENGKSRIGSDFRY